MIRNSPDTRCPRPLDFRRMNDYPNAYSGFLQNAAAGDDCYPGPETRYLTKIVCCIAEYLWML